MTAVVFFLGVVVGAVAMFLTILVVSTAYANKAISKRKEIAGKLMNELENLAKNLDDKMSTMDGRLKKVRDITQEQFDLQTQVEGPNKNSLDSRYKNGIIDKIKILEEEKKEILRTIISEGHDPVVKVITPDGTIQEMKLSEFMAYQGIDLTKDEAPVPATSSSPQNDFVKVGKFIVHKGGKDGGDNGDTTH